MISFGLIISFLCLFPNIKFTESIPLVPTHYIEPDAVRFNDHLGLYPIHHIYPYDDNEDDAESSLVLYKEVPVEPSYFDHPSSDPETARAGGFLDNLVMNAIDMFAPPQVKNTFNDTFTALQKQIKINDKAMKKEKRKMYNKEFKKKKKKRKPYKDADDENGNNSDSEEDDEDDSSEDDEGYVDDEEIDDELDDEFADEDKDEVSEFVDWIKGLIEENIDDDPNGNFVGSEHTGKHGTEHATTRQLELHPYTYTENSGEDWTWHNFNPTYSIEPSTPILPYHHHQYYARSGEIDDSVGFESDSTNMYEYPVPAPNANEYYSTYLIPIY